MAKNIVLCCDGTANEFAQDNTNVVKLYSVLEHDAATQVTYYHPGIGTMEPAGALTPFARRVTKGLGMAIGYGLVNDIRDAYVFLMRNYQPGDDVFLFGFSRGAYTARAVASLLHVYGLIRPDNESLVPYAIRLLTGMQRSARLPEQKVAEARDMFFGIARSFKSTMSRTDCPIKFVGVWDTVNSVGWIENPWKLPFISDNPSIDHGRHAIAIDERRAFFRTHQWIPSAANRQHGPRDVKQVWFPGVHCDVGGGYPEAESGLSQIALEWMLDEAQEQGLKVNSRKRDTVLGVNGDGRRHVKPNPDGIMHESLTKWWHLAEYLRKPHFDRETGTTVKRRNRHRPRQVPNGACVHRAALERDGGRYRAKLPADVVYVGKSYR